MNYQKKNLALTPMLRNTLGGMALLILSACAALPPDTALLAQRDASRLALDSSIKLAGDGWPEAQWWTQYHDAQLSGLISQALKDAPSLATADMRLKIALAEVERTDASAKLNVTADASIGRELQTRNGLLPPAYAGDWLTNSRATLNANYTFDWWGRHKAEEESALGRASAARADRAAAELVLSSAIAQGYYAYQVELARRDLAMTTLARRERLLKINQLRVARGIDPIINQRASEGDIANARINLAVIDLNIQLALSQMRALVGVENLAAPKAAALPVTTAALPGKLGLDLLGRRPDLVAARYRVEAALRQIDVAKAQFYPDVNLNAYIGLSSISLSHLLRDGSQIAGITPALHLPIFDSGRLTANLGATRANAELAIAQYNQSLVDALKEVNDQASNLQGMDAQRMALQDVVWAAQQGNAAQISRARGGLVDDATVIQSELPVLAAKDIALQLLNRRISAQIGLVRALGGGYTMPVVPPTVAAR